MNRPLWLSLFLLSSLLALHGGEIEFVEDYALSPNRELTLQQLIPGTEEFYYWYSLYYLQIRQFERADELLVPWVQKFGETPRVWQIRTRRALLSYDQHPPNVLNYLRNRFGIQYPHQQEVPNAESNLPTGLDPQLIAREQFRQRALAHHGGSLNGFETSALESLLSTELNADQRRQLLSRLERPDVPELVTKIAADLDQPNFSGFGSLEIHKRLLKSQLEELAALKPELLNHADFVKAYVRRLQPGPDTDWRHNAAELEQYLIRLQSFADRLEPSHNSLKAHVLYQRLVLDRTRGVYDKERFLSYLKLPRKIGYVSQALRHSEAFRHFGADLSANYVDLTLLPPVSDDEALVRSYLAHFFLADGAVKEFEPWINDVYLRQVLAETKVVHGLGNPEEWASQLSPEQFKALRERIDLDFDETNRTQYRTDDAIQLKLHVKNVPTLLVKVFEINTANFYRAGKEIDTDINLDGLVPNFEETFQYDEAPLRRVARTFDFPQLSRPGVYVIDFIGNGRSSRALIRKGSLKHLVRTTAAGPALTVLDERGAPVKGATVWLAGREYVAGQEDDILIPFSAAAGVQSIVLTAPAADGKSTYSALAQLHHEAENYQFPVGFYVDREQLLTRKTATLIVRPGLRLNGTLISLKRLEDVKLTIRSVDLDGTPSTTEVPQFQLFEDRESIHEFQVPPRLAELTFTLAAKTTLLTTGTKQELSATDAVTLNGIARTAEIENLQLLRADGQYVLELRGRTGEPRASRAVSLTVKHRDFTEVFSTVLKTDGAGRIALGALADVVTVRANVTGGTVQTWGLSRDQHAWSRTVHGQVGQPIELPYLGTATEPQRSELSLLDDLGEGFGTDRFEHLSLRDGLLVIDKLPAGDYVLTLKDSRTVLKLRITDGELQKGFLVGKLRQLEAAALKPVQIASIQATDEALKIQLANSSKFARVHVFATRYVPEYSAFDRFSRVRGAEPYQFSHVPAESVYLTGRNIGDEYRYIIDRKYARKYPGNLLERPALLLNPWAVRDTETGQQVAEAGERFGAKGEAAKSQEGRAPSEEPQSTVAGQNFASFEFLAGTSVVLVNLTPDEQGLITIPRTELGAHQDLRVVAVDPLHTTSRTFTLPEAQPDILDLRLTDGLDPQQHFARQKLISIVPAGQSLTLRDIGTARFEAFDSLPRVFGLYATLNKDPQLAEFAFLTNWPSHKPEAKRSYYSRFASHELNLFLFKKDPEFFQAVVQPYLANKRDKTFMDRFLLDEDLTPFLRPWNHAQLNIVERILLSQRVAADRVRGARHVADLYALVPQQPERFVTLFDTAVSRGLMELSDSFGVNAAMGQLSLERAVRLGEKLSEAEGLGGMPGGGPMGGGMGGGGLGGAAPATPLSSHTVRNRTKMMLGKDGTGDRFRRNFDADDKAERGGELKDAPVEFFADAALAELQVRQLYRKLEKTREWAENNYYHLTIDQQNADLITVNAFWKDFAAHDPSAPFLSKHLAEASRNRTEILLALAVLDLPFEAPKHETKFDGPQMTLVPGGPLIAFYEEVQPAAAPEGAGKVLVTQNFFKHGDRQRVENGETVDKFVSVEFVVQTVYGCQVVITNPTSTKQRLNVLVQIPRGALPVLNGQATNTLLVELAPFHTTTVEYNFYFPGAGEFVHFPVHVAREGTVIAAATPQVFTVVERPTKLDTESWDYVSQFGTLDEVLKFLESHNVNELNLDRIAWRMHDKAAFEAVLPRLAERHVYSHTLWSYALLHAAPIAAREFLQHAENVIQECGGRLHSTLLVINPVARRTFQFLEYKPLVNARAHALGERRQTVNNLFHVQYHQLLQELAYDRALSDEDLLAVTYYLLLQDRVEEALATFARVQRDKIAEQLQYDYCDAYLKFFGDEPELARAIAARYVDNPVDRWRQSFANIVAQLDEAKGGAAGLIDPENRDQQQGQLAATEPSFDFTVEAGRIHVTGQNLSNVQLRFYQMDVELLFSRNPFVQQSGDQVASILPKATLELALPKAGGKASVELPAAFRNSNVLVEVVGAGVARTKPYFSSALAVQTIENYGQVRVTHAETHKPVPKAYVKVYSRTAQGEVKFYKDGYTDLRGRFDYASLSTNELETAQRFSILVLSDEHGAVVREAEPPKQ